MKKYQIIYMIIISFFLCSCYHQENKQIEIEKHIYVEKEFKDSWLERCEDGRTYLQLVLDGGYHYQTDKSYLDLFFNDGGKIELYNYSIMQDDMIISGEFIPNKTIRLMHPHLENIVTEGVLMHEVGHYFDSMYQFSKSKELKKLYDKYKDDILSHIKNMNKAEFFAELFKEYTGNTSLGLSDDLKEYMEKSCRKILGNK